MKGLVFMFLWVNSSISFHDEDFFQVTQNFDSSTQMVSSVVFSEMLSMLHPCAIMAISIFGGFEADCEGI